MRNQSSIRSKNARTTAKAADHQQQKDAEQALDRQSELDQGRASAAGVNADPARDSADTGPTTIPGGVSAGAETRAETGAGIKTGAGTEPQADADFEFDFSDSIDGSSSGAVDGADHDAVDDTLAEPPEPPEPEPEPEHLDCGRFIASQMLARPLSKFVRPARPGLFLVQAPSSAWIPPIKEVISRHFSLPPGQAGHRKTRRQCIYKGPKIGCYVLTSSDRITEQPRDAERMLADVEADLAQGAAVFIVGDNLDIVPMPLRHAADRTINVAPPNGQALIALLQEIAPGTKRFDLPDIPVAQMTPRMLGLAYRPNTKVRPFLRRLKQLAAPENQNSRQNIIPLDRLHGVDEAKAWAAELKTDMALFADKKLTWSQARRSLLLCGVPGTAKTTLAGAIAADCNMTFVSTSYAHWQRSDKGHLGDVLRAMAASFAEARARAPSVLFIDELDTLGSRGGGDDRHQDWWRAIINALLEQIAGVDNNEGVIIIGATNFPEIIDPAIVRSGRMEERITLHPPEPAALARIFADQLGDQCDATVDMRRIGEMSAGMTGADVVRICAAAGRLARQGNRLITQDDLIDVLKRGEKAVSDGYRRRIAIHEAGHAVVMHQLEGVEVTSVTLIGTDGTGGTTRGGMTANSVMTSSLLETRLITLMGGRAAEAVLLGEVSAGSGGPVGSDLCSATVLAAQAELSLGLGSQGLIWQMPPTARNVGEWLGRRPDVAEAVGKRLDRAYARACEVIRARTITVQRLAEALLVHEALVGEELA
ncbi:MAG TPA: AAA family ATPase, partial [Acidiphilium sp.]|nr:AAA family ATPase [Acidiphilium sp.]